VRIAIDGMGGDFAPAQTVHGALMAASDLGVEIALVGKPELLTPLVGAGAGVTIVAASEEVTMGEHPARAVRAKPDSSMSVCARLCRQGQAAAWVSAGNSGAIMATAILVQGRLRGVKRPALGTVLPVAGGQCYFVDVGANVGSRPEYLVQFAHMGALYAESVMGRPNPRVGLLSNGEEQGKGDDLVQQAHARLIREQGLNFIGNLEPKEVLAGRADVVVADGFVGNVAIKMAEATAEFIFRTMRDEIPRTWRGRLGGLLIRPAVAGIRQGMDWREFGGAPLLGIDGVAVVAHGRSDKVAVRNAVRVAKHTVEAGLVDKIRLRVGR